MSAKTEPKKQRFDWIDQTKGLAILGIVLFHFFQNYPKEINLISILDRNGARVGYAAVDIFFVMAGFNVSYVLAYLAEKQNLNRITTNWKSWLLKRLNRIYPAYLLAVVCSLLLLVFFSKYKLELNLDFILTCLGFAGYKFQAINPGFWFFTVILEAYLAIPLIFYLCKSQPGKILILGIIGGVLTKLACVALDNKSALYWYLLQNDFLGSYFSQLCLGLYWGIIYYHRKSFRKKDFVVATSIFLGGLVLYLCLALMKIDIIYMLGFDILFTPFFFLLCYAIFEFLKKYRRLIGYILGFFSILGIYSYQIYLIHQPLYFVLFKPLTKALDFNPYVKVILVAIATAILLTLYVWGFVRLEKLLRTAVARIANRFSETKNY
ncbi:MAG: acyltransferase [Okeania sp. SIO2H7]|nr:acyltransferase [Okeania sp. SIO2H7]